MPKRKRGTDDADRNRAQSMRRKGFYEMLLQSKKLLHRALKTARGFERQKLGKRLKNARSTDDITRINREIEALKRLDLDKMMDAQLYKSMMKVKAVAESPMLPEEVKRELPKPEGTEDEKKALHNVTSGIWNTKPVQEAMEKIMGGVYIALGITAPLGKSKGRVRKESSKERSQKVVALSMNNENEEFENSGEGLHSFEEPSREGPNSGDESENSDADGGIKIENQEDDEELDEEILSRYDALIGASSDEESFDESKYDKRTLQLSTRVSVSISPSPSPSLSPPLSKAQTQSLSPSPPPPTATLKIKTKTPKQPSTKTGGSTFLPTLMGGYWSGSESSASDLEEDAPKTRKNRPGQMARRAIWEKKFGERANHIKQGHGTVAEKHSKGRDDGWDAKRGAKESGADRRPGRRAQPNVHSATGNNAIAVESRKRAVAKKDDASTLHPSWQAAKKTKEAAKTATFQGKKVIF